MAPQSPRVPRPGSPEPAPRAPRAAAARRRARHRARGLADGLVRSAVGRLLAATLVVVLSGLAVGSAGSVAQAAADDAFTVTLADGSPAVVAGSGTTPLATASPGRFTLPTAQASSPVRFSFVANCVLEDEACQDASATLELDELRLAGLIVPAAPVAGGVGYTVAYLDEHGAELGDPSADLGAVRAVRLGFVSYGADAAPVPLAGGSILEVALDATLLAPDGGGEQVGSVTVLPSVDGEAQTSSTVEVVTTVVPVLATTTTKTWTPADPYLSGAADTARTATVTFTSTGDTATSLVVEEPADPTAVPAGADAFNLLRVTGLSLPVWPAGATQLTITTWHDGVSGPSTTAADLGAAQAWLAALPAAELDRLTGVRLAFAGTFARGATGTLEVATAQLADGAATPGAVTGRHGAVAYDESGAVPTASASSDFHTVRVTNSADTTASSTVAGAQPATSAASAEFRIWDPEPYAGATKRFVRPGTATDTADVYPGGYAAVQLTGTSWTRRVVESLVLSDQPGTSDGAVAAAVQGVRAGGADARMFAADGLVMAGFGAGVAAGAGDGTGLVWPEGADALTLVVRTAGGTGTWTGAPGDALPTSLAAFTGLTGDPAWSDVTGLEARFTGEIAMGASGTVPYLVTTGDTAVPGTTVDNLVLARTTVGGLTSDPTPRTPGSGNKPVVADSLTIAEPYAAATLTKTIPEPFVDVRGGDVTAVLRGAAAAGTDLPTTLVLEDSRGVGSSGAWWARFAPTDVEVTAEGDVTSEVEYATNAAATDWQTAPAAPWSAATTKAWTGVRVVATKAAGARFDADEVVQAVVRFDVAVDSGTTFADDQSVSNCAVARAVLDYGGPNPSTRTTSASCDAVRGYDLGGDGTGHAALVKVLDTSVVEGSTGAAATREATLTWGTAGRDDLTEAVVADVSADGDGTVLEGRRASFWDTFDLVGLPAITSGATRSGSDAYDPALIFDQVADVQVYDVAENRWVSLAAEQWDDASDGWVLASGTRSDVTFGGATTAAFPYRGSAAQPRVFPGMQVVSEELRARAGGVRVVVTPLEDDERDAVVAGLADWRVPALSAGLVDGRVAGTRGPTREVKVTVRLRTTSRADAGLVVNDAAVYNHPDVDGAAVRSLVVEDGRVEGVGGSAPFAQRAADRIEHRTVTLTPTTVTATATKRWTRSGDNPQDITSDAEHVHVVPLPAAGGDPAAAVLAVTGGNGSGVPVDSLTLTEPSGVDALAGTEVGAPGGLAASAPFAWFALSGVTELTSVAQLPGATALALTAYVIGADDVVAAVPVPVTDAGAAGLADDVPAALAAAGVDPDDVIGLRLAYTGRIAPAAVATLRAGTTLRAANLVDGTTPQDAVAADDSIRVDNTVRVTVADQLVCSGAPETYPDGGDCTTAPSTTTATDHVSVQAPDVLAFASKRFTSAATVTRDAGTTVTAVLDAQSFGNSEPDSLTLTDADPTFFNAVALGRVSLTSLPTGATMARLDVLRQAAVGIAADGTYTPAVDESLWTTVGTRTAAGDWTAPAGGWGQVVGLRVVFAAPAGQRLATPGAQLGTVTLSGTLRDDLLSGGVPAATGADPAWHEAARNPGESADATIANTVQAIATRGDASSAPKSATASFRVSAGTQRLTVAKTSAAAPAGGWTPGSTVPYTITVTNNGTADVLGLVVTDRLPADDTLAWGGQSTVTSTDTALGAPLGVVGDAEAGTVTASWPAAARLAPGRSVTIVLPLTIAAAPSTLSIVNTVAVSAAGRPVVARPAGNGTQAACVTGTFQALDGATGACVVTAAALSMNASNVFVSEKWVSTGTTTATPTTPGATCAPRGSGGDGTWYRYPCVVDAAPGGKIDWQVQVRSMADAPSPSVTVVDMLPRPDDYQAMKSTGRGSQWQPVWDGTLPVVVPVTGAAGAVSRTDGTVRYFVTTADYTTTTAAASTSYDPLPAEAWTEVTAALPAAEAAEVTGLKVVIDYSGVGGFTKNSAVRLQWSQRAPLTATDGGVAWGSFAFQVEPENRAALASVPLKAGVRYAVPDTLFAVGDRVWHDSGTGDGQQGAGEPSVAGVPVALLASDGTVLGTTTTDADGRYLFDGLPAGTYAVRFELTGELAARYRWTTPLTGDAATDSDATPLTGSRTVAQSAPFVLADDAPQVVEVTDGSLAARYVDRTRDAGLVDAPLALGDRVWLDADHDGAQGPAEPGVAGVVVRVHAADDDRLVAATTTDADGWYAVGGLAAGDYVVEFTLPSGYRFSRPLQGGDPAADSDASRSTGRTGVVHLAFGGERLRATTADELARLGLAGWDAGTIDPTVDAGIFSLAVAGPVTDVTVRKDVDATEPVQGGDTLTYTLTAATTGTVAAEDVELTDVVPAELAVTGVDPAGGDPAWTCDVTGQDARGYGGTVHCVLADDLLPGATAPAVVVTATVDPLVAVDTIVNTATVGASNEDPGLTADDSDSATTPVRWIAVTATARCELDAPWLDYAVEAHQVDASTLPITLTWFPDQDRDGVADGPAVATRTLPAGSDLTGSVLWPGAEVDADGHGTQWPGWRTVRAGETPQWENRVLDPALPEFALRAGSLVQVTINPTRTVTVGYPSSTDGCEVGGAPELVLSKTAGTDQAEPGAAVDYTLAVRSTGVGATDDAVLTDVLPPELAVVAVTVLPRATPDSPTWTDCRVAGQDAAGYGGTVTCVLDGWVGQGQELPSVVIETRVSPDARGVTRNVAHVRWGDPDTGEQEEGGSDSGADVEVRSAVLADGSGPVAAVRDLLARTGLDAGALAGIAALLVLAGAAAATVRLRRRRG
ncbi:DUF11 domain-containing protein [Cellulomonas hominis]|uniref:SdrD B-like domain-containing protein n=1 Tax=Cellulomonas hominis TaxID=156981 RepID=UPI001C0FD2FA|nr:SdrD B-like domain-containing protein [Cellulomonas hominis]MBU5421659.1 DUF11 domain-containing protein [Cellulomonas hominis]